MADKKIETSDTQSWMKGLPETVGCTLFTNTAIVSFRDKDTDSVALLISRLIAETERPITDSIQTKTDNGKNECQRNEIILFFSPG